MNSVAIDSPGKRILLMGNEAIARGAIEAGVQVMAAYPGTPSSEIGETLAECAEQFDYYIEWSTNEKVAFEVAAGASMVGARSLVAMKNAGLNVAMDTFVTLPYTGIKGGMVVVVADDPDAHYSSTEQDTRLMGMYAEIMCLEPSDQQEAKDMTLEAFELSERLGLPVFLRSVTRISHASGDVVLGPIRRGKASLGFNKHWRLPYRWDVYGPPGTSKRHRWLHEQLPRLFAEAEASSFNRLSMPGVDACPPMPEIDAYQLGIIASGLGASYAREAMDRLGISGKVPFLKVGTPFPIPRGKVSRLLELVKDVIIVEEGDPVVELETRALAAGLLSGKATGPGATSGRSGRGAYELIIYGKGQTVASPECLVLPPYGEINTDIVVAAIKKVLSGTKEGSTVDMPAGPSDAPELADGASRPPESESAEMGSLVSPRSSTLCAGCPHLGSYWALREILRARRGVHIVNGDIGCYEQGGYGIFSRAMSGSEEASKRYRVTSPYEILDTIYVMGSGIGLAMGQVQAGYDGGKVVAVAGDSTFFHATLPAVVNAVYTGVDITFLILDNSWTCMTGHQPNPTTGRSTTGGKAPVVNIEDVIRAMGVGCTKVADAYDISSSRKALEEAVEFYGPSVVILRRECALQVQRRERRRGPATTFVQRELCSGCRQCVELGCPAVTFEPDTKKAGIDEILCVDCGLCPQVCPQSAIRSGSQPSIRGEANAV